MPSACFSPRFTYLLSTIGAKSHYARLSDDDDNDGTSVSIETQRKILGDYCRNNGFTIYDQYSDDGFSGTNFHRPDFLRMMEDAKKGLINTIIVKDPSRFGRNYLEVGKYLSDIFPSMHIRFIAIGDDEFIIDYKFIGKVI